MHQVWNNNVKQVRNIKLAYLPGLQKRTSMDGCNISSAPSSHLTKTLDEILWCSEPQNFLLKCICSISCKTNHKKTFNFWIHTFECCPDIHLPSSCIVSTHAICVIKFHNNNNNNNNGLNYISTSMVWLFAWYKSKIRKLRKKRKIWIIICKKLGNKQ